MKKIFTLAAATAMAMGMNAQNFDIQSADQGLACDYAGVCEIDIDNDGIKEVVIGGFPNWNDIRQIIEDAEGNEIEMDRVAWIMKWDGSKYVATQFSQNGVFSGGRHNCPHVIPADFNGDGNVDLYIASGGDANTINGIYLNNGNGGFDKDERFAVLNEDGTPFTVTRESEENGTEEFSVWYPRAVDVADFNLDGLPDIVSIGWWLQATSEFAMSGILLNNGDGTYTVTNQDLIGDGEGMTYCWALATVKAFDINNDGYADFFVSGNIDNSDGAHTPRTWKQYINVGADTDLSETPVQFYELGVGNPEVGPGNFNVADFNNDGMPDVFATGEVESHGWAFDGQLYLGKVKGGEFTLEQDNSFALAGVDIRPLNHNNVGTRAIDYNNDGFYDLFLPGWCESMPDGTDKTQSGWFLPGSDAGLTTYKRIPGASEQGVFFLDYGVEGALNYTFTGLHGDGTYFEDDAEVNPKGRSMVFTKSGLAAPARPDAPTNVKADIDGNKVTLSWDAAASSKKNVTYEIYLKKDGKIYNGCTSFIGGEKDGIRKVLREGNAYMNKTITLTLADGAYEWGVQTVNAALRGSVFAKGENLIVGDCSGIKNVETKVASDAIYNIAGQRVANDFKGIVIENGKKVIK